MSSHWLLTTHGVALFPMGVFLWNWKRRKDTPSIFMLIKFLYGVTFSLLYHSHHSLPKDEVFTTDYEYDNWALLDGYACSSLIFTTVLYGLRVREPQFYITSFAVENIIFGDLLTAPVGTEFHSLDLVAYKLVTTTLAPRRS